MRRVKQVDGPQTPNAPANIYFSSRELVDGANTTIVEEVVVTYVDADGNVQTVDATHPLPVSTPPARNTYDTADNVPDGDTAEVVGLLGDGVFRVRGFLGTGGGDGIWRLLLDGDPVLAFRTSQTTPNAVVVLPNPIAIDDTVTIELQVTNVSGDTASYEGTVLGE